LIEEKSTKSLGGEKRDKLDPGDRQCRGDSAIILICAKVTILKEDPFNCQLMYKSTNKSKYKLRRIILEVVNTMAFSIFIYIAWLGLAILYIMKKHLSKIEISVLIFSLFIIDINRSWITNEELKYITYSTAPLNYTAYIIHRTFITPIFLAIGINSIPRDSGMLKKIITLLISSFVLVLIKLLLLKLDIVYFHQWNLIYDYLYYIFLHLLGFLFLYWYKSFVLKGAKTK
jgi:hypothetical protein